MKNELIAVPVFHDRISPLMDVSDRYAIYETSDGTIKHKFDISLNAVSELQRVEKLKEIGANTIICGAVSGCIAHMVDEKGMQLLSMIHGPIDEIVEHYLNNSLGLYGSGSGRCNGHKRHGSGRRCRNKGKINQNKTGEDGQ